MKTFTIFCLGQIMVMLSATSAGIYQQIMTKYKVNFPYTGSAIQYVQELIPFMISKKYRTLSKRMKWIGFIQGLIDGVCCGLSLWAVKYTDAASVNLILTCTMPFTMIFNFFMNKDRYVYGQIIVMIVVVMSAVLYTIIDKDNFYPNQNKPLGDAMTILSTVGYGFEASYTEKYVKNVNIQAYLCYWGLGGFVICVILGVCLEAKRYPEFAWQAVLLMIPVGTTMNIFQHLETVIINNASAVIWCVFEACLIIYSFLVSIIAFNMPYKIMQLFAIFLTISCVIIYCKLSLNKEKEKKAADAKAEAEKSATKVVPGDVELKDSPSAECTVEKTADVAEMGEVA